MEALSPLIESYGVIIDQNLQGDVSEVFKDSKCPFWMDVSDRKSILHEIQSYFFSGQFGSKLHTKSLLVNEAFEGEVKLFGESFLEVKGDFSPFSDQPLLTWSNYMWMSGRSKNMVRIFP